MSHQDPSDLSVFRPQAAESLVPAGYAEKAMASLMQLHSELMEEKERRVDLYRRLMEKEQSLAELKMYVKLLEEKVEAAKKVEAAPPPPPPEAPRPVQVAKAVIPPPPPEPSRPLQVAQPVRAPSTPMPRVQSAPIPGPAFPKAQPRKMEDWKTW